MKLNISDNLSSDLIFHYVSGTEFVPAPILKPLTDEVRLRQYSLFNARIGYRFLGKRGEVWLMAHNLFNNRHKEYVEGEELKRAFLVGVSIDS